MGLGDNIRYLRIKRGYSQDYIAEKLGYKSYTTIQKWESGASEPPVKKLKELSILLNADMNDMANRDLQADENLNVGGDEQTSKISFSLNPIEKKVITKYRAADDLSRAMVHRALGMEEEISGKEGTA